MTGASLGAQPTTAEIADANRLDEGSLARWLQSNVEGFEGPLTVRRFDGGQSNPTYQLITPSRIYVLRKKPAGKLLPSAHAVDREFRVMEALCSTGFPVPKVYALCGDVGVIGSIFYVMQMIPGRVLTDALVPGETSAHRRALYESKITTLAQLHSVDFEGVGLSDFGKQGNYYARQIDRWSKQYKLSETESIVEMNRLMRWLPETIPALSKTSIVHGDFRLDNLIIDAKEPRVVAVLDWELSTLGDPLADFTNYLLNWFLPRDGRSHVKGVDLRALGIPEWDEVVAIYCQYTGRDGIAHLHWYLAYNAFRLACILQGIAGRVRDGTAVSEHAKGLIRRMGPLVMSAHGFAKVAGLDE